MGEVSDGLQAILDAIQAQQRSIDRLVEALQLAALDKLTLDGVEPETKPAVKLINWMEINGEERLVAWHGLVSFVHTIVEHYGLQLTIRPCWWQHVDAVEELTALWLFHQQCNADPANLGAAMNWRDTFARCRDRLREMFVSCRDAHVDARLGGTWMTEDVRQELGRAILADVSAHPPGPRTVGG